jgi:hypothetical protein
MVGGVIMQYVLQPSEVICVRLHLHVWQPCITSMADNPWLVYLLRYVVVSHLPLCGGRLLGGAPAAVWLGCLHSRVRREWKNTLEQFETIIGVVVRAWRAES